MNAKRKHRFSGDPSLAQLRKAQSVGSTSGNGNPNFLPLKSRNDFASATRSTKAKIRYDSESGISNEAFEAEEDIILDSSSNEQII